MPDPVADAPPVAAAASFLPTWHVAHTRPRCEKKFAALLTSEKFEYELPLLRAQRRYGPRVRVHSSPLFPGYVFLRVPAELRRRCYQQNLLVRLLPVEDELRFLTQLEDVRRVMASGLDAIVLPLFTKGKEVVVVSGPLRGLTGVVDNPDRPSGVIIRVDALQQGLLVKISASDLKLV